MHLRLWSSYLKRQTLRCQTETTIFGVNLSERFKRTKYIVYIMRFPHADFTTPLDMSTYIRHILFKLVRRVLACSVAEEMLHDLGQLHQGSEQKGEEIDEEMRKVETKKCRNPGSLAALCSHGWSRFFS